ITVASGAAFAIRRELWESLAGFDEHYFAFHEDVELSLRCWQRGLRCVYVPEAVVVHHYEFSRMHNKYFLIERNRLLVVATLFERRTLGLIAPAWLGMELATLVHAWVGGWAPQKLASWRWLARNLRWVRDRRRSLQS